MIFFSHTSADKPLVEPIAIQFSNVFGKENIFYDSWSIQPGDGIIDKMSEGMSKCKFFFFFVSKKSLDSRMVQLEWQNMLMRASSNMDIKFIPVKLDDCMMPAILLQTLYIDVYGKGLEFATRQMIDVVNGNNTFQSGIQKFENVRGEVHKVNDNEIKLTIRAISYAEPISRYAILVSNNEGEVKYSVLGENMIETGFNKEIQLNNGFVTNAIYIGINRSTTPSFPVEITLKSTSVPISFNGVLRQVSQSEWISFPITGI
ncbi:toll/interleukin-1 receptor domain-containing protein [Caldibacillus thermoamylovorans]|uniref:toll/interleukin-1 receptor domain-containing protein n=1 Tax=Caldibacillus thermoamylovorans TaxID=35841 RepID=UPI00203D8379|nr:toll/interleukin-1 receptor domain-containing protein [Caldibacillus thermoamylovorans]MCM3478944.1 toll/interleukin-1 receptor domain-containing protein [Caldibacillus thermoamylovorans]